MISQETSDNPVGSESSDGQTDQSNDAMASKLSKELSNWRLRRTGGRPQPAESAANVKFRSEPARTIRVRGHETLVIRKSRPTSKPRADSNPDSP